MRLLNSATYIIKKSKFIAYYYEVENEEQVKTIITNLKEEHKKARHIPYAYVLTNTAGKSDDKEPLNTAGLPLYNFLIQKKLQNKAILVVRYFGGTKLGAGGLLRAYLKTAKLAIEKN